jgi:formate hydrogenlyase subunit 4
MNAPGHLLHLLLPLALAPLFPGLINRTKALVAGRTGPPLLQSYRDLAKLLGKGAVYSRTVSGIFVLSPLFGLAAVVVALAMVPQGLAGASLPFPGDLFAVVCLLGAARLLTVAAALDTGSAFEGMGASRDATLGCLIEPVLLLSLLTLGKLEGSLSLSGILGSLSAASWNRGGVAILLTGTALFAVCLAENARIPVDDPATHLELTMIHEAMILDHGGPDLAALEYAAALRLWLFSSLVARTLLPAAPLPPAALFAAYLGTMALAAVAIGLVESTAARLRLGRLPQFLTGAATLSILALVLVAY